MTPSLMDTPGAIQQKSPTHISRHQKFRWLLNRFRMKRKSPDVTTRTEGVVSRVKDILTEDPKRDEIVAFLNKARTAFNESEGRKHRITLSEVDQEELFNLCNAYFEVDNVIAGNNPQFNIDPIRLHLYRIGTSVTELEILCWVKKV